MLPEAERACIYLVRHGETVWNLSGRLQGHLDSPLTAAGVEQARAVSRVLRHEISDVHQVCIETSPLGRAYETAKVIAEGIGIDSAANDPVFHKK